MSGNRQNIRRSGYPNWGPPALNGNWKVRLLDTVLYFLACVVFFMIPLPGGILLAYEIGWPTLGIAALWYVGWGMAARAIVKKMCPY